MQHLCGRIAKSDVRTYVQRTYVRTYASSIVSRHFGAETKMTPYGPTHVTRNGTEHQTRFLLCREGLGTRLTCTGPGYQIMRIIGASLSEPHIDDCAVNFPYATRFGKTRHFPDLLILC